jgi:hypothetical protein
LLAHFTITVANIVLVRVSVTSVNESFDRKISNIGYDLINNPYVSIYESVALKKIVKKKYKNLTDSLEIFNSFQETDCDFLCGIFFGRLSIISDEFSAY